MDHSKCTLRGNSICFWKFSASNAFVTSPSVKVMLLKPQEIASQSISFYRLDQLAFSITMIRWNHSMRSFLAPSIQASKFKREKAGDWGDYRRPCNTSSNNLFRVKWKGGKPKTVWRDYCCNLKIYGRIDMLFITLIRQDAPAMETFKDDEI